MLGMRLSARADYALRAAIELAKDWRTDRMLRHLEALRAKYKIKRNFIKLLDRLSK